MAEHAPDRENDAAHAMPAPWVNKFYVSAGEVAVRLTFAEQAGPATVANMRSAVMMGRAEAVALANLILELVKAGEPMPTGTRAN